MPDNNGNNQNNNDDDEYEKYCYLCRRPESEAGPFIRMPGNMYICNDCMQKSFDSFNNGAMQFLDLSKMPNINMSQFMPFDDIPTSQKVKKKKNRRKKRNKNHSQWQMFQPHIRSRQCLTNMSSDRNTQSVPCPLPSTTITSV